MNERKREQGENEKRTRERKRERDRERKRGIPGGSNEWVKREGEKARVREATRRGSVFFAGYRSCTVEAPFRATESPWRRMPRD